MEIFPNKKVRLHIELTGSCNLQCVYCFQSNWNTPKRIKNELSTAQIMDLIDQSKKIGCKTVTITGGEPFLRKDIYEIINYCQEFDVEILTNSTLLDKEKIKEIGEKFPQLKRIKISIDGLGGHDINRWPSNYKKIIENFNYFKRYTKCVLIANTVITQYTIDELMDLYKILKKIPINIWRIDLPFFAGRYINNASKFEVEPIKAVAVLKKILKKYFSDKKPFGIEIFNLYKSSMVTDHLFKFDVDSHPCSYSQWRTLCIKPNGDLIFCPSLLVKMANIVSRNGKINVGKAIKHARKNKFFKIKVKSIKKCVECRYLNICGSGCRADALYWEDKILAPDPVACTYIELMEKHIIPILPKQEAEY